MLSGDDLTIEEKIALEYCAPHGIPLSVFFGRIVYPGDPQWLGRDAQAAVNWYIQQKTRCSGCGFPQAETMVHEDDAFNYDVTLERCWACFDRDKAVAAFREGKGDANGMYFTVKRNPDPVEA